MKKITIDNRSTYPTGLVTKFVITMLNNACVSGTYRTQAQDPTHVAIRRTKTEDSYIFTAVDGVILLGDIDHMIQPVNDKIDAIKTSIDRIRKDTAKYYELTTQAHGGEGYWEYFTDLCLDLSEAMNELDRLEGVHPWDKKPT